MTSFEAYERACAGLDAPFALVDLDAMWHNAASMLARAAGKPIRVASKSVRCRELLNRILGRDPGFRGLMTFTLAETLWLRGQGFGDLLLAYPTADRASLAELARVEGDDRPIVMVDSAEQLDWIARVAPNPAAPLRLCVEFDTGYRLPRGLATIGPKRSPIRTPAQAAALAREIDRRPQLELAGLMGYEGHIAGVGDRPLRKPLQGAAIRAMQRASIAEIAERRAAIVAAVRDVVPVELVNGGGTGSLQTTAAEGAVTEVTAGSGFYASTLFDRYSAFDQRPAAMFALPVVRRPRADTVTLLGGGYVASGPAGKDRLPEPFLPAGLSLDALEGAGEVQTPVRGAAARSLRIGDNVYLRHAKAGELCERFDTLHLLEGGQIVDEVPTYRGEGHAFL
ncbi:MAG TPA: amino acid deaminase/aldolase [Thermoleophilaceae bacterium]|nr:amino acid deaminase/aldolase [Thermoleophilaceae bacterium]